MAALLRSLLKSRLSALVAALVLVAVVLIACQGTMPAEQSVASAPDRGYVARACGFDLDDDGDGIDEDLIYIDCAGGEDIESCGPVDAPCASITYAWQQIADGADDLAEDILCFRGTCSPSELRPAVGGVASAVSHPPVGSQVSSVRLPRDPTMLVGWDSDGDHEYPPFDQDDEAILDGGAGAEDEEAGLTGAFQFGEANSYLELGHFSVRDYGRFSDQEKSGFVRFGVRGDRHLQVVSMHDLEISGINQDRPAEGHRIAFNFFTAGTRVHDLSFVNLDLRDIGAFMVRGSGPNRPGLGVDGRDDGPLRWQRLSVTGHGCDDSDPLCRDGGGSAFIGWKLWGYIDGIEILDSRFDANVEAWVPKPEGNGGAVLVNATQCSRGWTVRNNLILDFKSAFKAQGGNGNYCGYDLRYDPPRSFPRPTERLEFAGNTLINRYQPWHYGDVAVHLRGGDNAQRGLGDVHILGNQLISTDGFEACIWIDAGHDGEAAAYGNPPFDADGDGVSEVAPVLSEQVGRVVIAGNACWGTKATDDSVGIRIGRQRGYPHVQQRIELRDNVIGGLDEADLNLELIYLPTELEMTGNRFDPDASYALTDSPPMPLEVAMQQLPFGDSIACEASLTEDHDRPRVEALGCSGDPKAGESSEGQ